MKKIGDDRDYMRSIKSNANQYSRKITFIAGMLLCFKATFLFGDLDMGNGLWKGSGTIDVDSRGTRYSASVEAYVGKDGQFLFHLDNHWNFENHDILFSYDGEDFYYVIRNGWHGGEGDLIYLSTGNIPLILFQDCARDALWYALGMSHFLSDTGSAGEIVNLAYGPRSSINAYGFRFEASIISQDPTLAKKILIYKDKSLDRETPEEEATRKEIDIDSLYVSVDRLGHQWQIKRDWPDGVLSAEVTWDSSVSIEENNQTFLLPSEFSVKTYPVSGLPGAEPNWIVRANFQSWEFLHESTDSFKPEIYRRTRIYDSRLRERTDANYVDHVLYLIDDNFGWRSKEDMELQAMFHDSLIHKEIPNARNRMNLSTGFLYLIFVVVAAVPLFLLFCFRSST